jgi:sortase A
VLDRTLTYQADQIRIVLPEDLAELGIVPDKDYCTLVTCTPYGVNTHRLLIRGHRVETEKSVTMRFSANALQIDPLVVMPFLYVPILLILFLLVMIKPNRSKKIEKQLKELQENP